MPRKVFCSRQDLFKNVKATIECPGCGLSLPDRHLGLADRFNTSGECLEKYYELTYWTLVQQDGRFIHSMPSMHTSPSMQVERRAPSRQYLA